MGGMFPGVEVWGEQGHNVRCGKDVNQTEREDYHDDWGPGHIYNLI